MKPLNLKIVVCPNNGSMNICYLTEENIDMHRNSRLRGGIIYIVMMYKYLSKKHNITILCWKNKFSFKPPIYSIKNLGRIINFFTFLFMTLRIVRKEKIDILVSKTRKSYLPGFIVAKLLKKPHIVHVGTPPEKGKGFIDKIDKEIYRLLLKLPHDKYLAVGEVIKNLLIKMGVESSRVHNVANAVDINKFKRLNKAICRKKLGLPINCKVIAFVGGLYKYKGVYSVLQTFLNIVDNSGNINDNVYLLMVGDGPEKERLMKKVKVRRIENKVIFYSSVRYEDMPVIYGASDIVVLPSYIEGLSRVIMESLACEVPVVATRIGGNVELIRNNKNGFTVEPEDIEDLKSKIEYLLNNKKLCLKFGKVGRKIVCKYTWERLAEKHELIFKNLLKIN